MLALLRKDLPWIGVFVAAGVLVVLGALWFGDPVDLLLFDRTYWTAEATFWIAFGTGAGLGWFAGIFDELLGARELLRHRPLSSRQLMAGKCLAVASVLVAWHLALPLVQLLAWPFFSFQGLPIAQCSWFEQQASLAIAWPVAFAMLLAAMLPLHWLMRFVVGGVGVVVVLLLVDAIVRNGGQCDPATYLLVCLALAGLLAAAVLSNRGEPVDRDLPFANVTSPAMRLVFVGVVVLAATAASIEWEASALSRLLRVYPEPWLQGGEVVLVATSEPDWVAHIVDGEHQRVDRVATGAKAVDWSQRSPWLDSNIPGGAPRWSSRVRTVGQFWSGGALRLFADGSLWVEQVVANRQRRFERLTVPGIERLSAAAGLLEVDWRERLVLVIEPGQGRVWRLDDKVSALRELPLPNQDRVRRGRTHYFTHASYPAWREQIGEVASAAVVKDNRIAIIDGERASYVLVGDSLRELPLPAEAVFDAGIAFADLTDDRIEFTRTLPATDEHGAFTHAYRPRTGEEEFAAFQVQAISSLRPPLLQVLAHVLPAGTKPGWLFDGLVAGGRRPGLVLLQVAIAIAAAWLARRYLAIVGAPRALWTAQVAVFGLPALVVLLVCESPWRLRRVQVPAAPLLRIGPLPAGTA